MTESKKATPVGDWLLHYTLSQKCLFSLTSQRSCNRYLEMFSNPMFCSYNFLGQKARSFPVCPVMFCHKFLKSLRVWVSINLRLFAIVISWKVITHVNTEQPHSLCQTCEERLYITISPYKHKQKSLATALFPAPKRLSVSTSVFELSSSHLVFSFSC